MTGFRDLGGALGKARALSALSGYGERAVKPRAAFRTVFHMLSLVLSGQAQSCLQENPCRAITGQARRRKP